MHHQQAVQGLAGMAPAGSTGSQLEAACLPRSGCWHRRSVLLGPEGRLSESKALLPSAGALPSFSGEDMITFHPAASILSVGGSSFRGALGLGPLGGQSIHVNKCLTYQTASIR